MVVLAAFCLALLAVQTTVFGVALLWFCFSAFQNGEYATLSAAIPDHVPVRQRATLAGLLALPFVLFTPNHPVDAPGWEPFSWRRLASADAQE